MSNETFAETILRDLKALVYNDKFQRYVHHLQTSGDENEIRNGRFVVDALRGEFLAGKETGLEDLCQSGNLSAIVYAGYDEDKNVMRFWPVDERAQIVYLAGYAAMEGHPFPLADLLYVIL